MTLTHRLLRRLGKDTVTEITREEPLYLYTIEHTNGDVTELYAHGHRINGAYLKFWRYTDIGTRRYNDDVVCIVLGDLQLSRAKHRTIQGVQEVDKEVEENQVFTAAYDQADGVIQGKKIPNIPDDPSLRPRDRK